MAKEERIFAEEKAVETRHFQRSEGDQRDPLCDNSTSRCNINSVIVPPFSAPVAAKNEESLIDCRGANIDGIRKNDSVIMKVPFVNQSSTVRPLITVTVGKVDLKILLDTGADISLISLESIQQLSSGRQPLKLQRPVMCLPYNAAGNAQGSNDIHRHAVIHHCIVLPITVGEMTINFPFHVHPQSIGSVIAGADFLRIIGGAPHLKQQQLLMFASEGESDPGSDQEMTGTQQIRAEKRRKERAEKYTRDLLGAQKNYKRPSNDLKEIKIRMVEGIELKERQDLLYPKGKAYVQPGSTFLLDCELRDGELKQEMEYMVSAISRATMYDLQLMNSQEEVVKMAAGQRNTITLGCYTTMGVNIDPSIACATIAALPIKRVALADINANQQSFPENSAFKPAQLFDELPLPNEEGVFVEPPDYSEEDYRRAAQEVATYVTYKKGVPYIMPREGIELLSDHPKLTDAHRVLTAKTLGQLPHGTWFQDDPKKLPGIPMADIAIRVHLENDEPIYRKPKRMNSIEEATTRARINEMLEMGIIEECSSPYSANVTWAPKADETLRFCINYKPINKVTIKDRYPLPRQESIIEFIKGCSYITLADIKLGFHNLSIHPDDRHKLAFSTPFGQYQPIRLPFGWCNGPPVFQRQYDFTIAQQRVWAKAYVDDLIVKAPHNHRLHDLALATVFYNNYRRGFSMHAEKCQVLAETLQLLGIRANGNGVQPSPAAGVFDRILQRRHVTLQSIQRTIGTLQWFKRFVPNFTYHVRPILILLRHSGKLESGELAFDEKCKEAVKKIKAAVDELPLLHHADPIAVKEIYLAIGKYAFATVLYQVNGEGQKEVLEFWSKVWPYSIETYIAFDMYALAIREAFKYFSPALIAAPKVIVFVKDAGFVAAVADPKHWTRRMKGFLATIACYTVSYRVGSTMKELQALDDPIPENDDYAEMSTTAIPSIAQFFNCMPEEVLTIPIVFTDGSCMTIKGQGKQTAVGVFWSKDSPYNVSRLGSFGNKTNQRAELEAALVAIKQAKERGMQKLIINTDSSYAANCMNTYRMNWQVIPQNNDKGIICTKGGLELDNSDIFYELITAMNGIKVYFNAIPREFNQPADELSRVPLLKMMHQENKVQMVLTRNRGKRMPGGKDEPTEEALNDILPPLKYVQHEDMQEQDTPMEMHTENFPQSNELLEKDYDGDEGCFIPLYDDDDDDEECFIPIYEDEADQETEAYEQWLASRTQEDHIIGDDNDELPVLDLEAVPTNKLLNNLPPMCRIAGPQINDLVNVLIQLPMEQRKDAELAAVIEAIKKGDDSALDRKARKIFKKATMERDSGALVVADEGSKLIVPGSLKVAIMELFHKSAALGAHLHAYPTTAHIKRYFWWKSMTNDVFSYCNACAVCKSTKPRTMKPPGLLTPPMVPTGPFQRIHADTIRGLPPAGPQGRYKHVLVVVDSLTKMIFTYPLTTTRALPVIDALTQLFSTFGPPQLLKADRGSEFISEDFVSFVKLWGVKPAYSMAANPQGNGQAEAAVKIITQRLTTMLRQRSIEGGKESYPFKQWIRYLPYVTYAYNSTPNRLTGLSPFELVFGRSPWLPNPKVTNEEPATTAEATTYSWKLKSVLDKAHAMANQRIGERNQYLQRLFNSHRQPLHISEGDFVYLYLKYSHRPVKLSPKAFGPFQVKETTRHPESNEIISVSLNMGTKDQPKIVRFPRYRVRPIGYRHPATDWEGMAGRASEMLSENQPIALDDMCMTNVGQRLLQPFGTTQPVGVDEFDHYRDNAEFSTTEFEP